ncbi:MAG: OmpA family protein [Bacteroidaceae bacterium]|nr:OmpA family protein [Bacteroidaceae bacterium]
MKRFASLLLTLAAPALWATAQTPTAPSDSIPPLSALNAQLSTLHADTLLVVSEEALVRALRQIAEAVQSPAAAAPASTANSSELLTLLKYRYLLTLLEQRVAQNGAPSANYPSTTSTTNANRTARAIVEQRAATLPPTSPTTSRKDDNETAKIAAAALAGSALGLAAGHAMADTAAASKPTIAPIATQQLSALSALPSTAIATPETFEFRPDWPTPIYFRVNQSALADSERYKLDHVVDYLLSHPRAVASLAGFASSDGPRQHNDLLAKGRLTAVVSYLLERGVPVEQIRPTSTAIAHHPIAPALTRKVDITIGE